MKVKSLFKLLGSLLLMLLCSFLGANGTVMFADATTTDLEGGGKITNDAASLSVDDPIADDNFFTKEVDKKIAKIRRMSTPIDQISRMAAKNVRTRTMEVKYYSVGTKPIMSTVSVALEAQTTGKYVEFNVTDPSMFSASDTIRVVGVKGYKEDGATVDTKDLMLYVSHMSDSTGMPVVYAANGKVNASAGNVNSLVPAIEKDTVIIRMGKACAEKDQKTSAFSIVPTSEVQYCQIFIAQIEQSTIEKMSSKEVDWEFDDLEEATVSDMKMGIETTTLFGIKNKVKHPKTGDYVWSTGGIYWMAGKDMVIGKWDAEKETSVITDDNFVDFQKAAFTGNGAGNKHKLMFCGSEFLATLAKMQSEHDRNEVIKFTDRWDLKFRTFESNFGTIDAIHHELFDVAGMSDKAFLLDPEFLTKMVFEPFSRKILDLKASAQRNADAVLLREISCSYLTNPQAHGRVSLAKS